MENATNKQVPFQTSVEEAVSQAALAGTESCVDAINEINVEMISTFSRFLDNAKTYLHNGGELAHFISQIENLRKAACEATSLETCARIAFKHAVRAKEIYREAKATDLMLEAALAAELRYDAVKARARALKALREA